MNREIGYGDLCREAERVAAEGGLEGYYVWRMHRPENMDVYLGEDVTEVTAEDVAAGRCAGGVLMLPERRLERDVQMQSILAGRPTHRAGGYLVVVIR